MNPLNHATLEASNRLVDAGIVLETEKVWVQIPNLYATNKDGSSPLRWECRDKAYGSYSDFIPAPSRTEVWRELPEWTSDEDGWLEITKDGEEIDVGYHSKSSHSNPFFTSTNPTDALIDLLIWVRKEKEDEY
jgi:hypothetical protein